MENSEFLPAIKEAGLSGEMSQLIESKFIPFLQNARGMQEKAFALVITDENQTVEMAEARKARLLLKQMRVDADHLRKELKEDSLRYGKAVQGVYNIIEAIIVPMEKHLQKQEDFAEIQRENRRKQLHEERFNRILPLSEFTAIMSDYSTLTGDEFERLITGAELAKKAKADREKAEAEAEAKRKKEEEEERERVRVENERLKAEAKQKDAEMEAQRKLAQAEKERLEAEANKERQAREAERKKAQEEAEKIQKQKEAEIAEQRRLQKESDDRRKAAEAELQRQKDEADRIEREKAEAEAKAKAAPDNEKINAFIAKIKQIERPEIATESAKKIMQGIEEMLVKIEIWATEKTKK